MSDFAPNPFPSRRFVRFIAHKQLIADATGITTTLKAQRYGKDTFHQQFTPGHPVPTTGIESTRSVNELESIFAQDSEGEVKMDGDRSGGHASPVSTLESHQPFSGNVDNSLFEDILKTTVTPENWPALYQACETPEDATALELKVAAAIVSTYRQIKFRQQDPVVQQLNQLLGNLPK